MPGFPAVTAYNFNPRSPWGERPVWTAYGDSIPIISIHAPRGGSDFIRSSIVLFQPPFQSTLPVGGATRTSFSVTIDPEISIHAPRGGSDLAEGVQVDHGPISIHAPRGGSDGARLHIAPTHQISIHAPRGGERLPACATFMGVLAFQSTLPVGGSDYRAQEVNRRCHDFNPRSPWGERLILYTSVKFCYGFQSTLPVGGATPLPR